MIQCADVTFTNNALSESDYNSHCSNGTRNKITAENMPGNPNGTASGTGTSSGTSPSSSAPANAAAQATVAGWLLGAVGAAGLALL